MLLTMMQNTNKQAKNKQTQSDKLTFVLYLICFAHAKMTFKPCLLLLAFGMVLWDHHPLKWKRIYALLTNG